MRVAGEASRPRPLGGARAARLLMSLLVNGGVIWAEHWSDRLSGRRHRRVHAVLDDRVEPSAAGRAARCARPRSVDRVRACAAVGPPDGGGAPAPVAAALSHSRWRAWMALGSAYSRRHRRAGMRLRGRGADDPGVLLLLAMRRREENGWTGPSTREPLRRMVFDGFGSLAGYPAYIYALKYLPMRQCRCLRTSPGDCRAVARFPYANPWSAVIRVRERSLRIAVVRGWEDPQAGPP